MLQTEFPFTLPCGYVDREGTLHREGVMRLATAYVVVILLSRVVIRLGELTQVNPGVVEGLFAADLAYLQELYRRVNENGSTRLAVACPHCQGEFEVETAGLGG
jgi:hypothetical protein